MAVDSRATSAAANAAAVGLARALLSRFLVVHAERRRASGTAFGPSSEEVARVLRGGGEVATVEELAEQETAIELARRAVQAAFQARPEPLLARLCRAFGLSGMDLAILAVLLAPELDHELERAYTFAIDDFTRKRGDIGFIARLIGAQDPGAIDLVLTRLSDDAPLRRNGVVTISAPTADAPATLRGVRIADRIMAFLRGHDTLDELVHGIVQLPGNPPALDGIVMNAALVEQISRALTVRPELPLPVRVLLAGPEGAGRGLIVEAIYGAQGRRTVRIDLTALVGDNRVAERFAAAMREAALRDAAAILDGASAIAAEVPRTFSQAIADASAALAVPMIFTLATRPAWLANAIPDLVELDVPPPTFRERIELWTRSLPPPLCAVESIEIVSARYAFTGAVIERAARRSIATARLRNPEAPEVSLDDLGDAARLMFSHRLGTMAQRIPTGFKWEDLVLPPETLEAVREVVKFARFKPFLLEEWGFAAKLPYGRGLSAIMAGPPGTGKTMVAQLLAKELGYDLYRIDLSQVVNKYIGETEKNLGKIFNEAENSHAVLFFDEADSLFAKRTEVKSSNDRYANLEVNYLLQRMETFDGVTLLATNLEQGIDEAFKRRVRFSIMFELPEEVERRRLWRSMFPKQVPLDPDIDWDALARTFVMAGGYIKKAALRAALFAAETRRAITTADLLEAGRQEYREMGRII